MYPHITTIRVLALAVLSQLGFPGDNKYLHDWRAENKFGDIDYSEEESELNQKHDRYTSLQSALTSIYGDGVASLDDIGLIDGSKHRDSIVQHMNNLVNCYENGYQEKNKHFYFKFKEILTDNRKLEKFTSHQNLIHSTLMHVLTEQTKMGYQGTPYPVYWYMWTPMRKAYVKFCKVETIEHLRLEKHMKQEHDYSWQYQYTPEYYFDKAWKSIKRFTDTGQGDPTLEQFKVAPESRFYGKTKIDNMYEYLEQRLLMAPVEMNSTKPRFLRLLGNVLSRQNLNAWCDHWDTKKSEGPEGVDWIGRGLNYFSSRRLTNLKRNITGVIYDYAIDGAGNAIQFYDYLTSSWKKKKEIERPEKRKTWMEWGIEIMPKSIKKQLVTTIANQIVKNIE